MTLKTLVQQPKKKLQKQYPFVVYNIYIYTYTDRCIDIHTYTHMNMNTDWDCLEVKLPSELHEPGLLKHTAHICNLL